MFRRSIIHRVKLAFSRKLNLIPSRLQSNNLLKYSIYTGLGVLGISSFYNYDNVIHACGLVAYIGKNDAVDKLLEGIQILQNRGYDSAGISTLDDKNRVLITKMASVGTTSDSIKALMDEAPKYHSNNSVGIGHTRWATHGGKTDENAHPHNDYKNRISIVHNGTIENSDYLKAKLVKSGINFKSDTDTEVIAQLIGYYLDRKFDIMKAVQHTLDTLEGTWGLAIIYNKKPNQIIAARNGSPLVVGLGNGETFLASEVSAFSRHTKNYIALRDGEIALINRKGVDLDRSRIEKAPDEYIELSPAPYAHWTLKEIYDQPQAIARALNYGGRFGLNNIIKLGGLDDNQNIMLNIKNLVITGCGTSLYASIYGAKIMRQLRSFNTVQSFDAAELLINSFPQPTEKSGILAVSQSGETKDTHRALILAEQENIKRFSIVNRVGSLIARTTNCGVYLNAGREHAVASTKAFTTQVTVLSLIASWFAQHRSNKKSEQSLDSLIGSIHRLPIYAGMSLRTHDQCKKIAKLLKDKSHMFVLGKGYGEPIAYEGALKIKEITYVHAEGFGGGSLKHGPFALLEHGTPIILLIFDDEHSSLMKIAAQEVKARGSHNIIITDNKDLVKGLADPLNIIEIPSNGMLTALLSVIPLQLIAYEMAVGKNIDPDKPRNLAKAVTVD